MYETNRDDGYGPRCRSRHRGCGGILLVLLVAAALVGLYRLGGTGAWLNTLRAPAASPPPASSCSEPPQSGGAYVSVQAGDTDVLTELQQRSESDPRFVRLLSDADVYPEDLLKLALKNEEAMDFVLDYPNHMQETVDAWSIDLSGDCVPGAVPLLLQWDGRWGYAAYGSNLMGLAGCGPTCLSMVIVGLTGDLAANPLAVAEYSAAQGWYVDGQGTSWDLMRSGAEHFGLNWQELPLDESTICQALDAGACIIASMTAGDFTDSGHFVVISGYSADGFHVLDPNSRLRSGQNWSYASLSKQINNLWAYSA
jgi:hypothetical protein